MISSKRNRITAIIKENLSHGLFSLLDGTPEKTPLFLPESKPL
jgi:hypothetical protein